MAGCAVVLAVYILFTTRVLGMSQQAFLVIGGLIAHDAYRRLKFPHGDGGPGVVEVGERQITYLTGRGGIRYLSMN